MAPFQDRLVSELRLAQAATLEQANAVLARFLEITTPSSRKRRGKPVRPTAISTGV